jgi:conjugal transfer pilus assembly protein TrbC
MKKRIITIATVSSLCAAATVFAQVSPDLDIAAIEKMAEEHSEDAQALFDFATQRAEVHQEDAADVVEQGYQAIDSLDPTSLPSVDGAIDFDELVAGAQSSRAPVKAAPLFIAFASLSMPEEALSRMIAETTQAGGVVVFRGFSAGGGQNFIKGIQAVVDQQGATNVAIDPRLFRAFNVDRVPTYVAVSSNFEPCDQLECVSEVPAFDRISGNVSVEFVLETFADANGAGAPVARTALKNLRGG